MEKEIRRAYGSAADAIISLEEQAGKNETEGCLKRIDIIEKNWAVIRKMFSGLRSSAEMREVFKAVGCPCQPSDIGVDRALLKDSFMYSKDTRARYTVMQLAWDLGVLDEVSDRIIARLEKTHALG